MYKLMVSTHDGVMYNEELDYVVIGGKEGEFAILENHANLITTMQDGFLKLVRDKEVLFIALNEAAIIFHNNLLSVAALEAFAGNTKQRAFELLVEERNHRLNENRKIDAELEIAERKIKENIKEAKAGNL